jgi:PIN domain nuclease of toxin-antitoxin system
MGGFGMMVLDTCAVIWLAADRERFSRETLKQIEESESLLISTMSFWEIGAKLQKKKLDLPLRITELVNLYRSQEEVALVAPDANIILEALNLKWDHKDPVDRIIAATALEHDASLVTADKEMRAFYRKTII